MAKLFNMQTKKLKIWDSTFVHLHQETLTSKTIIKEKEQFLIKREEELLKDYEMKKLELEKQYLSKTVASKELQIEKPKEIILSNTQVKKEVISERNPMEIVPNGKRVYFI